MHLGKVAVRGERGALVVSVDTLMRATSNPFFDFCSNGSTPRCRKGSAPLLLRDHPMPGHVDLRRHYFFATFSSISAS